MDAEFIRDDNVPDGTCVYPGSEFSKCWLLRNTGSSPWTQGTVIEVRPLGIDLTPVSHVYGENGYMYYYLNCYFCLLDDWRQHAVRDGAL